MVHFDSTAVPGNASSALKKFIAKENVLPCRVFRVQRVKDGRGHLEINHDRQPSSVWLMQLHTPSLRHIEGRRSGL